MPSLAGPGWGGCYQAGAYLQLEPDLITSLDAGQAQLPAMDAQEHSVGLDRHHIYLL